VYFSGSYYTRSEHAAKGQTHEQQAKAYGRWWREPFRFLWEGPGVEKVRGAEKDSQRYPKYSISTFLQSMSDRWLEP
jgi:hypothetical protein